MAKELSPEARRKLAAIMARVIPVYEAQQSKNTKGA